MPGTAGPDHTDDSLHRLRAQFPLGRPFGLLPASGEVCAVDVLPFGLRRAVVSPVVPVGDLSAYGYDHDRQIGIVREGDRGVVPLFRHTHGQTRTVTRPDGRGGPDSDADYRED
jgi:putative ATP-grasp target RiPP